MIISNFMYNQTFFSLMVPLDSSWFIPDQADAARLSRRTKEIPKKFAINSWN